MRQLARLALAALALAWAPAHAAVVGGFTAPGQSIDVPLAFEKTVFNSAIDVKDGLAFTIAPGLSGPVTLEILEGTKNVKVAAAAIGGAFGITDTLPLLLTSDTLGAGLHQFALGVVASGNAGSAIISRLTLTPLPSGVLLLGSGAAALAALGARRRPAIRAGA